MVGQLRSICRDLGLAESGAQSDDPAEPARVHAALLAGLLSHVGMRREDGREYLGARNSRFVLAPGSVLTKRPPRWVVVAELVETSRLYGRIAARIQPEVVERVAGELAQRSYSEPHWDAKRGEVMAYERVTLYGVPLAARRRVGYSRVEPTVARQLFIRHALVEGDWQTRHHVFADNARLRTQLEELEERARRRGLLVDDDDVYELYDARITAEVVSARHFDTWWKKQRHQTPDLLTFTRNELLRSDDPADTDRPDAWQTDDAALPLTYRFEPAPPMTASRCTCRSTCLPAWGTTSSPGRCRRFAKNWSPSSSAHSRKTCAATSFRPPMPPGRCWPGSTRPKSR